MVFWTYIVILIISGFAGLLFTEQIGAYLSVSQEIVTGLSTSLLIAGLLGCSVDQYLKKRFAKDLERDVFHAVYGHDVPKGIRDEIASILKMPFCREEYSLSLTLNPLADHPGYYQLHSIAEMRVRNLLKTQQVYPFRFFVEACRHPQIGENQIVRVRSWGFGRRDFNFDGNVPTKKSKRGDVVFEKKIKLPSSEVGDTGFLSEAKFIVHEEEELPPWECVYPTVNISVTLTLPENFEGGIRFCHPTMDDYQTLSDRNPYHWRKDATFLPFQGVAIWWKPKSA